MLRNYPKFRCYKNKLGTQDERQNRERNTANVKETRDEVSST